ncbi:TIGR03759 family integrating conjugative element protein [Phocoenobacter skyensis]|uniref:TIGR03759 family integrating conjugative element protein n=1 Tax=Phocoenobacter skyensis TaxID=97481 RepID=UPI002774C582|nr:TIGR03759 family integrating conjugative element protein [Pasteurella skyensis]MDP8185309.1 TIGR03759 family integrating conjugative element protein [Pasteurella skyensis]
MPIFKHCLVCLSLFPILALAENTKKITNISETFAQHQRATEQDINRKTTGRKELEKRAREWGLTTEEWNKYLKLSKGERGFWSPGLDPLTVLGTEAKTVAERERYARLLARKMHDRVEREIAFQLAYDKAFKELYPNELPLKETPHISQSEGRVFYFTRIENCNKCDDDINRILKYVKTNPIDIFFVGAKNDNAIRKWATYHKIDVNKVKQRLITLNKDAGYWLKYTDGQMPAAYQVRKGKWEKLNY